jgi:hypothetical protein
MRTRIDKWDCIKFENFCTTKETITIIKRKPTEWEKIYDSYFIYLFCSAIGLKQQALYLNLSHFTSPFLGWVFSR